MRHLDKSIRRASQRGSNKAHSQSKPLPVSCHDTVDNDRITVVWRWSKVKLSDPRAPDFDGREILALSLEVQERRRVQMSRTCHRSSLIHVRLGSKSDLSQARVMEPAELGEEIRNGAGRTEWNPHMSG
jgi:hypothetical protein